MKKVEELRHASVAISTKKQNIICFFYSDTLKQDCIDFIREISRLHDNTEEYNISVKMYSDFNKLDDKADLLTSDILNAVCFVSFEIDKFFMGVIQ